MGELEIAVIIVVILLVVAGAYYMYTRALSAACGDFTALCPPACGKGGEKLGTSCATQSDCNPGYLACKASNDGTKTCQCCTSDDDCEGDAHCDAKGRCSLCTDINVNASQSNPANSGACAGGVCLSSSASACPSKSGTRYTCNPINGRCAGACGMIDGAQVACNEGYTCYGNVCVPAK